MQEEEVDRGSESGEMDAGLQMDAGAVLVAMAGAVVVLAGGVNWPLAPLSELTSLVGELFFLAEQSVSSHQPETGLRHRGTGNTHTGDTGDVKQPVTSTELRMRRKERGKEFANKQTDAIKHTRLQIINEEAKSRLESQQGHREEGRGLGLLEPSQPPALCAEVSACRVKPALQTGPLKSSKEQELNLDLAFTFGRQWRAFAAFPSPRACGESVTARLSAGPSPVIRRVDTAPGSASGDEEEGGRPAPVPLLLELSGRNFGLTPPSHLRLMDGGGLQTPHRGICLI
ncbi:hypothetical protein EYF80_052623 [Liparis tanakae]|uniref:Uncharacterized protein n=1 Tax=Liparis tanakae TaxID=230148 RepID=A0A4Z2F8U0_9TELE|nr:hypothetical protein EYF80_052623 [Liparis tanakae]